ncbi:MAG: CDP-glycerol glycerophosphotransferase family protein, partial [Eubacterium sp.]|nr:CDP-glycerol glycerophosphotransferase family protein [Eubacterium sp.]
MIRRFTNKLKKATKSLKANYINYLELNVNNKLVLLEGGQGTNINGNMFSMLNELNSNPRWSDYTTVFVVTQKTLKAAEKRMKFYGFDRVILTVRDSDSYCKYLATAKYLLTDNSFPPYFYKREEQVFLNTWHGTPLKTLGKSDKSNFASLANIQKNYLMSDYALFPNEFTRRVFMEDYDLKYIFKGDSLIANYPRNYVFYDKAQAVKMKEKLGYGGKKLFAYMPTWRGTGRAADTDYQLETTKEILKEFDKKLDDDTVLLVNLHFLLASNINCKNYKHIDYFSSDYDTYEILNACDGLITDYSSVFFDYAVTGKKVILYAYDKERYLRSRGVYMSFDGLPFPIVQTVDEVLDEMKAPQKNYDDFVKEYCPNGYVDSCEKLFELMVNGKSDFFKLEKQPQQNICLIYAGGLEESQFDNIKAYINKNPNYKYVITYRHNLTKEKKDFILSLEDNVSTLGTITLYQLSFKEMLDVAKKIGFNSIKDNKVLDAFFEREKNRLFYSIKPAKVIDFSCRSMLMAGILSRMTGDKEYILHGEWLAYSKRTAKTVSSVIEYERKNNFKANDFSKVENKIFLNKNRDEIAVEIWHKASMKQHIFPLYLKYNNVFSGKQKLMCVCLFSLYTPVKTRLKDTWLTIGGREFKTHFLSNTSKNSKKHFGIYRFSIDIEDVLDMPATNAVELNYKNPLGCTAKCHVIYNAALPIKFLGLRSQMIHDKKTNTVAIFRQARDNRLNIYVRSRNVSDAFSKRIMQVIAFAFSLLWHGKKADSLVILYEKNAAKYEESASVLYEKLLDSGYDGAHFVVTKEALSDIPEKYRKNALIKHTFKHYLYFFKAKTFIGTETIVHSIDLKTFNKLALAKIESKNLNYVFLQHGVMYMVSLDSESRKMFKRKKLRGKYRVVVSSQAEADHFVELGKHLYEDLYITGLPKFDKSIMNDAADKIIIMPTWRPWEINTARDNFLETSYFKMIMKIYNSVPEDLKDKVIILPHPLIVNELKNLPESVSNTIVTDAKYDLLLREARVLITDYSSIAYDAFYL